MQYRYIADLHLYDPDSIDWRPNISLRDYAEKLELDWNRNVEQNQIVIIVGDVGTYCQQTVDTLLRLNGIKILVLGNHDLCWGKHLYSCHVFSGIYESIGSSDLRVVHIPPKGRSNIVTIHGHHHDYFSPSMLRALKEYAADTYRYNCAADLIGNRPCTLPELQLHKALLLEDAKCRGYKLGG